MASVTEARGAVLVVTLGNRAAPFDAVACTGRDQFSGSPLCEEPNHLPGAARHRLFGRAIASLQSMDREMGLN
jgi:hypothetical protein